MAKQLWVLRHGDAEPHGRRPDELRALTERGERQSRVAGRALAALGVRLDAVYASSRTRALDTARLACAELSPSIEVHIHEPLSAGFDGGHALELLARYENGAHIAIVGHEPDLSGVVAALTGADIDLKKGGLAVVRLEASKVGRSGDAHVGEGKLIVLARPSELALIAGMTGSLAV